MSRLKMSCVSGVHCHISLCLLLVEVFAIPEEPCYQILKMLSSPPRLPSTAGDGDVPRSLFTVSHFLLSPSSPSKCQNLFQAFFSSVFYYLFHMLILSTLFNPTTSLLVQVLLLWGLGWDFFPVYFNTTLMSYQMYLESVISSVLLSLPVVPAGLHWKK